MIGLDDIRDHPVIDAWCEAILAYVSHGRARRLRELRGDRSVPGFDMDGNHPPSTEWGRVLACEELLPGLSELRMTGSPAALPRGLRREGYDMAQREFVGLIAQGDTDVFGKAGPT